jgi:hypothetical protein
MTTVFDAETSLGVLEVNVIGKLVARGADK